MGEKYSYVIAWDFKGVLDWLLMILLEKNKGNDSKLL